MEDQPGDAPAVENPLPPVNSPIQPVNSLPLPSKFLGGNNQNQADMCALSDRFWYSKQIKPGTGWNISLFNRGLCGWHRQNVKHKRLKQPFPSTKSKLPPVAILQPVVKPQWTHGHLYSRFILPRRKVWVQNSERWTYKRQNYCWSPRWCTVWPPTSWIWPHSHGRCLHEPTNRSKKTKSNHLSVG